MQWHVNDADGAWQKRLFSYKEKYKAAQYLDYLPIWQTVEMFAAALERGNSSGVGASVKSYALCCVVHRHLVPSLPRL